MNPLTLISSATLGVIVAKSISDHADFNRAAMPWRGVVETAARSAGISPHLLAAVLYKESRFDPTAEGSAGEIGMGQFKPIAAEDVKIDFASIKAEPEVQIQAAAKLLRLNADRADGNIFTSVRAYNVGIGKARSDASAGVGYALDVFRLMAVDWLNWQFGVRDGR